MTSDGVDRGAQLPLDDWADQDLLTKDEARRRLIDEIDRTQARLSHLVTTAPRDPEIPLLTRRLDAMKTIRGEYGAYLDEK
jgi:hypothetical protein